VRLAITILFLSTAIAHAGVFGDFRTGAVVLGPCFSVRFFDILGHLAGEKMLKRLNFLVHMTILGNGRC